MLLKITMTLYDFGYDPTSDFIFCEMYIFIYQIFAIDPSVMIAIYKTGYYLLIFR